ncbi:MAG: hypothetical protein O2856_05930 [Planctomycetota bacterium]|nr:hypothetical protein [Planctomycetota bacterium]
MKRIAPDRQKLPKVQTTESNAFLVSKVDSSDWDRLFWFAENNYGEATSGAIAR